MPSRIDVRPPDSLVARVHRLVAPLRPVAWTRLRRGYTPAERWVVQLNDGSSVFVKGAVDEGTAEGLRTEHRVYSTIEAGYLPELRAWDDDDVNPVLLLEDLSAAYWPPPWRPSDVELVLDTLAKVRTTPPPDWVPAQDRERLRGWPAVAEDPRPFLSLRLCSEAWLNQALPDLVAAEGDARIDGDALVHVDVRSDNLCVSGDRVVLVDWNLAARANPLLDVAAWLPSLHSEGGPPPEDILPDEPELAALISGFFASRAGLPKIETAPSVRGVQLEQLRSALPWAVRSLGLPAIRLGRVC